MIETKEQTYSFAEFEIDASKRRLSKNGSPVALNPKAFDLLLALIENRGRIVQKEELLEAVWANQFVEENNLTVHISALRKIFGEKKGEHKFIVTIPGKGYKFVAGENLSVPISPAAATQFSTPAAKNFNDGTAIIGRAAEIAEIKSVLRESGKCLLTLTGAGGSGKTKLARAVAVELQADFADGVFFVELAAVNRAELVISAIAQSLEVKESGEKSLLDALKDFLRSREILLVLDNFEQLLSAANLLKELLDSAANLKIVVTSRTLLHLKFEREKIVSPLAVPPPKSNLSAEELSEYAAVELFAVRARAAKPGFALNAENASVIAEICNKLDGLPLAIELAAVRVKLLSPPAISARLENSLKLLTGGANDLPERQRTMRGAIEWSYELLDAEEQILFRRLAVFANGFTVEAAEAVLSEPPAVTSGLTSPDSKLNSNDSLVNIRPPAAAGGSDLSALDLLTSLIDNNLLVQIETASGNERLRMLEVVREFAFEKLEKLGEMEDLRSVHARFFLALAEAAEPFLQGEKANEWLEKLEAEHDNFRAALGWSLEHDAPTAVRIAAALRFFWSNNTHYSESRSWLEAALKLTENSVSEARFKILSGLGTFCRGQGDLAASQKFYAQLLAEGEAANDSSQLVKANYGLAAIALLQKDFDAAQKFNEAALAISRELKDETLIAYCLCSLGDFEMNRENWSAARPLLEESLTLSKKISNNRLSMNNYFNLGTIDYFEDFYEPANFNFTESLRIAEEMGNRKIIAYSLDGFAALAAKSGNYVQSAKLAGAASAVREKIGFKVEPTEVIFREKYLAETRAALNPQDFTDAYETGRDLDFSESIALTKNADFNFSDASGEDIAEIIIENHSFSRIVIDEEIERTLPEKEIVKQLPPKRNNRFAAYALIGLLVVAGIVVWFFVNRSAASAAPIESIAVMPFVYEGGNSENEYLSDGMTESLINNLSQLPKLTVKARNSVFQYKGKQFDANKIAGELSVQAILLGRITERGDNFILSLELVDAKTNNHLWGEQYTRKTSDLATLQTEIARDVSAKLRQKLNGGEALQKGQTANSEAYQLYLKGRFLWNKRRHEEHLKALAAFEQAIQLDPNFALAYAGIGDVYTVDSFKMADEERDVKGKEAALKALEIEPNLAEAYAVLAKLDWSSFKRAESERYFKRAIELNPNYASAHQWYAESLIQQVRIEEAIREIKRALELDPLSRIINSDAAYIYTMARQEDNAIAQANKILELDAGWHQAYEWRGAANESKGNYHAALDDFEKANELSGKSNDKKERARNEFEQVRAAFEKSGEQGYWQKSLEIIKNPPDSKIDYYFLAVCYAQLGDKENALDALEKAFENKNDQIDLMKVEPYFDNLQSEPRFQTLLRKIGL